MLLGLFLTAIAVATCQADQLEYDFVWPLEIIYRTPFDHRLLTLSVGYCRRRHCRSGPGITTKPGTTGEFYPGAGSWT